jgi:phage tail sheath protein FI
MTGVFVRSDRSPMTRTDLDNGRLLCLIAIAPPKPAEFVIFRNGQWTGRRDRAPPGTPCAQPIPRESPPLR